MSELKDKPKFLSLAFPFIEKTIQTNPSLLRISGLTLNSHYLLEPFLQEQIISEHPSAPYFSIGGGQVQALVELAKRGFFCSLFGRVGTDVAGNFFRQTLLRSGIEAHLIAGEEGTSQVLRLHQKKRGDVLCCYLGASFDLDNHELEEQNFDQVDTLFLDANMFICGFLPYNLIHKIKKKGGKVYLFLEALSDLFPYQHLIRDFIRTSVSGVIAKDEPLTSLLVDQKEKEMYLGSSIEDARDALVCALEQEYSKSLSS